MVAHGDTAYALDRRVTTRRGDFRCGHCDRRRTCSRYTFYPRDIMDNEIIEDLVKLLREGVDTDDAVGDDIRLRLKELGTTVIMEDEEIRASTVREDIEEGLFVVFVRCEFRDTDIEILVFRIARLEVRQYR